MKKWVTLTLWGLILSGFLQFVLPQSVESVPIRVSFVNSATGVAVGAVQTEIVDAAAFSTKESIRVTGGARVLRLPAGEYFLQAKAEGFRPLWARLSVSPEMPEILRVHLDPVTPSPFFTDTEAAAPRGEATLIHGVVVREPDRQPLAQVRVQSAEGRTLAQSDSRGYFALYLPPESVVTLVFRKAGFRGQERRGIELWAGGDRFYRIALQPGEGTEVMEENRGRLAGAGKTDDSAACTTCGSASGITLPAPALLPRSIRVGRDCPSATSCRSVEVFTLETYLKRVLPAEWFACWGSLGGGMHSLRAGAVAVRSYAGWHTFHPLTGSYDICDNTFCQFLGDVTTGNTNRAVDETAGYVLVDGGNNIQRTEYSAENNNSGCGDGYSGTGTTWPCIYDPVCTGQAQFGHGRGLCQWGSIRWANGTVVSRLAPCSEGVPHGFGTKTWQEILRHYYPDYQLAQAAAVSIAHAAPSPDAVNPGQTFGIDYDLAATTAVPVLLGASVRTAGSGWISDPPNDALRNLSSGANAVSRLFTLPPTAAPGSYDLLVSTVYDLDGNGRINSGDFTFDLQQFDRVLSVGVTDIEPMDTGIPTTFRLEQNYPNPFNPETTIAFDLPRPATVKLKVYNVTGSEVATLVDGVLPAGQFRTRWAAVSLASGVYFYRLSARSEGEAPFTATRKLVLNR